MSPSKTSEPVIEGPERTIEAAIRKNGSVPALEYYDGLSKGYRAKFWYLFKLIAKTGKIHNKEKFKLVEEKIFEFKAGQHRILCFWANNGKLILTNGFYKKSKRIKKGDLDLAKNISAEYRQAEQERGV